MTLSNGLNWLLWFSERSFNTKEEDSVRVDSMNWLINEWKIGRKTAEVSMPNALIRLNPLLEWTESETPIPSSDELQILITSSTNYKIIQMKNNWII